MSIAEAFQVSTTALHPLPGTPRRRRASPIGATVSGVATHRVQHGPERADTGPAIGAVLLPFPAPELGSALVGQLCDLQRYANKLARQNALARDLVQETCRRALETRARFASGTNLRSWLFCILRNLYCDHVRRVAREARCSGQDVEGLPSREGDIPMWRNISDSDVALALASLPLKHRQAYVLHSTEGKSYAEIARELEIPLSTVGTRLLRARRRLCRFLMARMPDPD